MLEGARTAAAAIAAPHRKLDIVAGGLADARAAGNACAWAELGSTLAAVPRAAARPSLRILDRQA